MIVLCAGNGFVNGHTLRKSSTVMATLICLLGKVMGRPKIHGKNSSEEDKHAKMTGWKWSQT